MKDDDIVELITQTGIKKRGWSKKMIDALLPEPILKTNPVFRSAHMMKLWKISDIEEIEKSDSYKSMKEKYDKRKSSAIKAVESKRVSTEDFINEKISEISVVKISTKKIFKYMLKAKRDWNLINGNFDCDLPEEAPNDVQVRWAVNYIRHHLTTYDKTLYNLSGKVGREEVYQKYRKAVLESIKEVYPEFKDECDRQINRAYISNR